MLDVRPPAVAGLFYEGDARLLAQKVDGLLQAEVVPTCQRRPKALIVPHAGHIYSGPIAASAYARLAPFAASIRRVVLLGPSHRVHLDGLALPGARAHSLVIASARPGAPTLAGFRDLVLREGRVLLARTGELTPPGMCFWARSKSC